jgi:hypothetical protein
MNSVKSTFEKLEASFRRWSEDARNEREFHSTHSDDHTRIVGISPEGEEIALQGFNRPALVKGLIESCTTLHRLENPTYLVARVNTATGEVNWA